MTGNPQADCLCDLVTAARAGDVAAYGRLVQATQAMSLAVAANVLRDRPGAEDAVQEAYLRAYRRLGDLEDPAAFAGWLRWIVITAALNLRRARRQTLLSLDEVPSVPVLDETERRWSDAQRQRLAAALLTLSAEERRICDRRYHGGWPLARLADAAGMTETTMRKRLQRIRDRLRQYIETEEIEMARESGVDSAAIAARLPGKIVALLASPRLTDIPENPVGSMLRQLREPYPEFSELTLPEIVDVAETIVKDAMYVQPSELHRIDANRILRYDLTLPMLLTVRYEGRPVRAWSSGRCSATASMTSARSTSPGSHNRCPGSPCRSLRFTSSSGPVVEWIRDSGRGIHEPARLERGERAAACGDAGARGRHAPAARGDRARSGLVGMG